MQQQLRCVFVALPPLLSAIIANTLARRFDLRILAETASRERALEWLADMAPDLLVLGIPAGESVQAGAELLQLIPCGKVLVIHDTGDSAVMYEMRPHRSVLSDFSPDNLLTFVFGSDPSGNAIS